MIASRTRLLSRSSTGTHSVQPVAMSVSTKVCTKLPPRSSRSARRSRPRRTPAARIIPVAEGADRDGAADCSSAPPAAGDPPRATSRISESSRSMVAGLIARAAHARPRRAATGHAARAPAAARGSSPSAASSRPGQRFPQHDQRLEGPARMSNAAASGAPLAPLSATAGSRVCGELPDWYRLLIAPISSERVAILTNLATRGPPAVHGWRVTPLLRQRVLPVTNQLEAMRGSVFHVA